MKRFFFPTIILLLFVSCQKDVYYIISTTVNPKDAGSVSVSPAGPSVLEGTSVTVTAQPKGEYVFTGWSGSISGNENPKSVVIQGDMSVTAQFILRTYPLTLTVEGEGAVSENVISTKTDYSSGTVVELIAQPQDHWMFDHWEGDISGNTNPVQITISSAKTVKAVFVKKMYYLTVEVQGSGAVDESVIETKGSYQEGTVVELTAKPSNHWIFDHWEGDLAGKDNPTRITVSSAKKVKAVFVEKMYPLSVEVEGNGAVQEEVISTKSGSYQEGTIVELTAKPGEHWVFDHWEGNLEGNQNPVQVTIVSAQSVKAVFIEKMYPLTVEVQGGGAVKEEVIDTKSGSYREGSVVQLTATPNTYWAFDHWEGDIAGTDNPALITISAASSVKAVFVEHDPGIVFTETEYISSYDIIEKLGAGLGIGTYFENWNSNTGDGINGQKISQQFFDNIKARGFKTLRFYIMWSNHFGPAPDYVIDSGWLDNIASVVDMAEKAGMNIIIETHDNAYSGSLWGWDWVDLPRASRDPAYNQVAKATISSIWKQIARRFRDKGDFLIFEGFNEIGSDDLYTRDKTILDAHQAEYDTFNDWNQVFVDAVRSTGGENAKRWLITSPMLALPYHLDYYRKPKDYVSNNRLMVSTHYYEPGDFAWGVVDEWGHTAQVCNEVVLFSDESFILDEMSNIRKNFMDRDLPICMNEFGAAVRHDERGMKFLLYYLEYVAKAARDNGMFPFHFTGEDMFNYETGQWPESVDRMFSVILKACYCDDPSYTLQSVYDSAPFADEVDDSIVTFSDPVFEHFVLDYFDRDQDGFISAREALLITDIEIETDNVSTIQGVERFVNLKRLIVNGPSVGKGKLTSLDLSANAQLEELSFINNAVSDLNISGCKRLKRIVCWSNQLKGLDITQHPKLELLACAQNQITSLDFSHCPHLREVAVNDNLLTSIDVTCLPNLEILECGGNLIKELDVSKCPNLKQLNTTNSPFLTKIILAEGQTIDYLEKDSHTAIEYKNGIAIGDAVFERFLLEHFDQNQDGIISLSEAAEIRDVEVSTDSISTVQALQHAGSLTRLSANGTWPKQGQLTRLDMSHNPLLDQLFFLENNVSDLNINGCTKLVVLACWGNNLSELDVTHCPELEVLYCAQNHLTSIDISKCPNLRAFAPNDNDLEELDLSNNPVLDEVEINGNPRLKIVWLKKGQEIRHFIKDNHTEIRYKE